MMNTFKKLYKEFFGLREAKISIDSKNPAAIELLKENQDKINWELLSTNEEAIELLKENPDKIYWKWLSKNKKAIELLKENPDKNKQVEIDYVTYKKESTLLEESQQLKFVLKLRELGYSVKILDQREEVINELKNIK